MKKLVYTKSYPLNPNAYGICVNKEFKEEIREIFKGSKHTVRFRLLSENSVEIEYKDYSVLKVEYWFDVLSTLKDNGFEFSKSVSNQFAYCEKSLNELNKEREILRNNISSQNIEKPNTILWCLENGCETTLTGCKKCRFTNRGISCEPVKVIKEIKDGKNIIRRI